jgi:cytochrome P450
VTGRIFKEAIRLYPPVHSLGREASRDVEIGGHRLARGAVLIVSAFLIHRREDLYPRPDDFAPSRFGGAAEERLPRLAYLPFGAGPRVCIGGHLATMEAVLVLAHVAQRVRFEPISAAAPEPEMLITLRPRGPLTARVRRRGPAGHRSPPG